ncbi:MAG: hypothetical protein K5872_07430 [Rhizobiaceae bacterium]|nr:hypothetical protein [Rhizobiaceae bacterium]MCV0406044.1 hypothetical protein [Rhizobiaceae bacterium]
MDEQTARWDGRLRRIIAVLVALAVLAERAADRSFPVRCFVLWILRRAEAVVAEFVAEATGMPQPAFAGIGTTGNDPEDALLLAARLHALAEALPSCCAARSSSPRLAGGGGEGEAQDGGGRRRALAGLPSPPTVSRPGRTTPHDVLTARRPVDHRRGWYQFSVRWRKAATTCS